TTKRRRERRVTLQGATTIDSRLSMAALIRSCALLGAAIVPTALVAAWAATRQSLADSLVTAAIAAGTCWLAGALALAATYVGARLESPLHGLLVGMLFRMGLPLAAILVIRKSGGSLAGSGLAITILV